MRRQSCQAAQGICFVTGAREDQGRLPVLALARLRGADVSFLECEVQSVSAASEFSFDCIQGLRRV